MTLNSVFSRASDARFSYAWLTLAAIFAIRAFQPAASGTIDPDVWWHVLYGHWIIDHRELPTMDMWSWTFQGTPYRLTQWLGEVIIAIADLMGGDLGRQVLAATLTSLTLVFSYRTARCFMENRTGALMVTLVCGSMLVSMTCRPHQFTFLGLAALTWMLALFQTTGRRQSLYPIPLVMAAWVNLHGGYALGLAYLWFLVGATLVASYVEHDIQLKKRTILYLLMAATAGTVATLANPYGIGAWGYTVQIAALKSVSAGLTEEWMPTSIRTVSGLSYLTIVLSITMALAFSKHRPSVRDALIAITLLALGWSASRVSLMISVLLVPILAQSFRDTPLYALAFAENKSQSEGALKPWQMMFILGLATLGSAFAGAHDTAFAKKVNDNFPVAETAFMQEHGITGRIMNTIEAGGYLIAKLQRPVFLDTRLDLYGDDFYFAFMAANGGQGNWRAFMDKWQPDVVLLEHTAPLKTLLIESGTYRPVFNGPRYAVLVESRQHPEVPTIAE